MSHFVVYHVTTVNTFQDKRYQKQEYYGKNKYYIGENI